MDEHHNTQRPSKIKRRNKDRDYKAEYERRLALGKERGITSSQARGHPKKQKGEKGISEILNLNKKALNKDTERRFC